MAVFWLFGMALFRVGRAMIQNVKQHFLDDMNAKVQRHERVSFLFFFSFLQNKIRRVRRGTSTTMHFKSTCGRHVCFVAVLCKDVFVQPVKRLLRTCAMPSVDSKLRRDGRVCPIKSSSSRQRRFCQVMGIWDFGCALNTFCDF